MTGYAVVDVIARSFVFDEDDQWLFPSRAQADALRLVEHAELQFPPLLIAEFDDPPTSAQAGIDSLEIPDGPLLTDGGNPDSDWSEVRRSTPAEYVAGIPDDATVYAAWNKPADNEAVTVYKTDERYAVVHHEAEVNTVALAPTTDKEGALGTADSLVDGVEVKP